MFGYALRRMTNLSFGFCSLNKQSQPKTGMKAASYTFDVINHYDQISKIKGKGAIVSLFCHPQYQLTKQGLVLAQFKLIYQQMKQGLPLVTGWSIPDKFLFQIHKEQAE